MWRQELRKGVKKMELEKTDVAAAALPLYVLCPAAITFV
jgi:hypothetical protein